MKKKAETSNSTLRILGVDPGTATTGWAIIEKNGDKLLPLAYGHISTSKDNTDDERIFEVISKNCVLMTIFLFSS